MKNIAIMLGLLLGAAGMARFLGADASLAGRIGIAAVFAFTAVGHLVKTDAMAAMLPSFVPARALLTLVSGVFEAALAILVLVPDYSRAAGVALCVFLVLVTPLNVYAAIQRIDFGGHVAGPRYLLARLPVQLILLLWTWWFAVRVA